MTRYPRIWLTAAALILFSAPAARAQNASFDVQLFRPSPHGDAFFTVESGAIEPSINFRLSIFANYAYRPLQIVAPTGSRVSGLVDYRLDAHLLGAITFGDRVSLGFLVPAALYQGGAITDAAGVTTQLAQTTFGDVRFEPKIGLLDAKRHYIDIAALLAVTFPTGNKNTFNGDRSFTASGELDISRWLGPVHLGGNFGYTWRQRSKILDLVLDQELYYRGGLALDLGRVSRAPLAFIGELFGRTSAVTPWRYEAQNPLEWSAGLKLNILDVVNLSLGGGRGVLPGYGAPGWRAFFGFTVIPARHREPSSQPSKDAWKPLDRDNDGIPDAVDKCPYDAEDKDGFEDEDGCPDIDNDKDGIFDIDDKCPNEPEDKDGFEDADGCPDPDNDKDGIPDTADKCPNEPEDKDGFEDDDGCPDPDNDKDGIPDAVDKCPNEPETINGFEDTDGCPDQGQSLVIIKGNSITILQKVNFKTASNRILPNSFGLLDQVAATLKNHAEIKKVRVEGHTDSVGDAARNLKLSQARADAVMAYLVQAGVDPGRLVAIGYGMTKPIASNKTGKGREMNRRVAFTIVEEPAN